MSDRGATKNTDRELWRAEPGDHYSDSIHVTQSGAIGINCGGVVHVRSPREWHRLAEGAAERGMNMRESHVQGAILSYLEFRANRTGCLAERMNTGALRTEDRFVRFGTPGGPDIRLTESGRSYAIEVKGPRGKQTLDQAAWQHRFELAGGTYILARSLDDVIAALPPLS